MPLAGEIGSKLRSTPLLKGITFNGTNNPRSILTAPYETFPPNITITDSYYGGSLSIGGAQSGRFLHTISASTGLTTNRSFLLPDANCVAPQGISAVSHKVLTALSGITGAFTQAQLASTDLSDTSNLVLNNQANTYSTGVQDFHSATALRVPLTSDPSSSAGAVWINAGLAKFWDNAGTPVKHTIALTDTPNAWAGGQNLITAGSQNIGSNTVPWADLFLGGSANNCVHFGQTFSLTSIRTINVPDANTVLPVAITATSHQFLTGLSSTTGVFTQSQPAYSDISGSVPVSGTANQITATGTTSIVLSLPSALTIPGTLTLGGVVTGGAFALTGVGTVTASALNTNDLGSTTNAFRNLYLSGASSYTEVVPTTGGPWTITLPGATGTVALTSGVITALSGTANQITVSSSTGASTLSLPSAITLPGTLTLGGTVSGLGNLLSGVGTVTPNVTATSDLGSSGATWLHGYFTGCTITGSAASPTISLTGTGTPALNIGDTSNNANTSFTMVSSDTGANANTFTMGHSGNSNTQSQIIMNGGQFSAITMKGPDNVILLQGSNASQNNILFTNLAGNLGVTVSTATISGNSTFLIPNANCNPVQPITAVAHNVLTACSSAGVFTQAQLAFSDISGAASIANGGTNNGSLSVAQGAVYYGNGSALTALAPGTLGQYLQTSGASANPVYNRPGLECQGRLTLATGAPFDQSTTAGTTLYFTPCGGNVISLYNTTSTSWVDVSFSEISIAVPSSQFRIYDVFVFNSSGAATLELNAWDSGGQTTGTITAATVANPTVLTSTNTLAGGELLGVAGVVGTMGTDASNGLNGKVLLVASRTGTTITPEAGNASTGLVYTSGGTWFKIPTARTDAIVLQNGIYVKSADHSRRYVGTFMTTGTSGQSNRNTNSSLVWNYYNRAGLSLSAIDPGTTYTFTTTTYQPRHLTRALGVGRMEYVVGVAEDTIGVRNFVKFSTSAVAVNIGGIGLNAIQSAPPDGYSYSTTYVAATTSGVTGFTQPVPSIGYTFGQVVEKTTTGTATVTANGSDPAAGVSGIVIRG